MFWLYEIQRKTRDGYEGTWMNKVGERTYVGGSKKILLVSEILFTFVIWYVKVKARLNVCFCQKNRNRPSLITLMHFLGTCNLIYVNKPFLKTKIWFHSFSSFYLCWFIYFGLVEFVLGLWFSKLTEINSQNSRNTQYLRDV